MSAKQGNILNDKKVAKTSNQALSPLADALTISNNVFTLKRGDNTTDTVTLLVRDNVTSSDTKLPLSANQGKLIYDDLNTGADQTTVNTWLDEFVKPCMKDYISILVNFNGKSGKYEFGSRLTYTNRK